MARIGIGVPVFDGERYLQRALDSLLGQTYPDFEIVISDNASTDATGEIGREYARSHERVRYHRNETNIGAAPNFNRCVELTSGDFFMGAAHDDLCEPTFLERCVEQLEEEPDAVLAYPDARIIDDEGRPIEDYGVVLSTDHADPAVRFAALLLGHKCFEVFGLIRRSALDRTGLIGCYAHGDGVLLAQLALRGRFVRIPEPLFLARQHAEQSMQMVGRYDEYAEWFDARLQGRKLYPHWRIHWEMAKSALRAPLGWRPRARALYGVARSARFRRGLLWRELVGSNRRAG